MNYAICIRFNGTNYSGWQVQPNAVTLQATVQDAVEKVFGSRLDVTGCSRTDAGVHAKRYFFHVKNAIYIPIQRIPLALNTFLPDDIRAFEAYEVDDSFHARYSAVGKEYLYLIENERLGDPFVADFSYRYGKRLDDGKLNEIASSFVGKHDFTSFMAAHSKIEDTEREVLRFEAERDGNMIRFYVSADGFLYNMARIMVGTVLAIHEGRRKKSVAEIINAKDRAEAGPTLPAKGLYLNKVFYEKGLL